MVIHNLVYFFNEQKRKMQKALRNILDGAKKAGEKVLIIWSIIFLTIAYFTVFGITALILKLLGKKMLVQFSRDKETYWIPRAPLEHSLEKMKKQG